MQTSGRERPMAQRKLDLRTISFTGSTSLSKRWEDTTWQNRGMELCWLCGRLVHGTAQPRPSHLSRECGMKKLVPLSLLASFLLATASFLYRWEYAHESANDVINNHEPALANKLKTKLNPGAPMNHGNPQKSNRATQSAPSPSPSPAAQMLESAGNNAMSKGIAAKNIASFCAPYYKYLADNETKLPVKIKLWCDGIETRISASQLAALSEKAATMLSPTQQAVAHLMSQKPTPEAASKAMQLIRLANGPEDLASSADILKRLKPGMILDGTALDAGDPRADTMARFAGMASWCNQRYCGSLSEATMLVCTWPGFTCVANDDFSAALARNFSPTDMNKIATVAQRLTEIRSGY